MPPLASRLVHDDQPIKVDTNVFGASNPEVAKPHGGGEVTVLGALGHQRPDQGVLAGE